MAPFRLAINMAGAVSAGAYSAGVLDYLTEALDAWYEAKRKNEAVPSHDVEIDVISGASAGGMCAAIAAVQLQDDFKHITNIDPLHPPVKTNNRLYESWVNQIDIRELLKTDDLTKPGPVISLLDSTIIDKIAGSALTRGKPLATRRKYVAENLTLFLSLTNLRGVIYSLNGVAPGSVEETAFFYGDRIRFQTVAGPNAALPGAAYPIDVLTPAADYALLKSAAMATGAFPLFLAPRSLMRRQSDFTPPVWESARSAAKDDPPPVSPSFPPDLPQTFPTLNVDGGVTDNDPFNLAHDYLAFLAPPLPGGQLETEPLKADRAVVSIAPFPTVDKYDVNFDIYKNSSVLLALPRLFAALIAQSRFFGESLSRLMRGTTFSHFIVAPSDHELTQQTAKASSAPPALECATLNAFGGFFSPAFRAHDYALGRRNCQQFLREHFVLPECNVVMQAALNGLTDEAREELFKEFGAKPPTDSQGRPLIFPAEFGITPKTRWLPIIPLCSDELTQDVERPVRSKIGERDLNQIVNLMGTRFTALSSRLVDMVPHVLLRWFLRPGPWAIALLSKGIVKSALAKALGDSYQP